MQAIQYPNSYVVWDLETSGLDPVQDKILEIGAIVIKNGEKVSEHNWVLNNKIEIPAKITEITGITKEIIDREGIDPVQALVEFEELISHNGYTNLTHNGIKFDIPFFAEQYHQLMHTSIEARDNLKRILFSKSVDSAVMVKANKLKAVRKWNENFYQFAIRVMDTKAFGVKFNVGLCCEEMDISREGMVQHRTGADTYLTNEIYKKLINK